MTPLLPGDTHLTSQMVIQIHVFPIKWIHTGSRSCRGLNKYGVAVLWMNCKVTNVNRLYLHVQIFKTGCIWKPRQKSNLKIWIKTYEHLNMFLYNRSSITLLRCTYWLIQMSLCCVVIRSLSKIKSSIRWDSNPLSLSGQPSFPLLSDLSDQCKLRKIFDL